MEKAVSFKAIHALDRLNLENIGRFYFGEEFCERLLPSNQALKEAVNRARELNKGFSLLTPPVTDMGLSIVKKLISQLDNKDEVVINDYGILDMACNEFGNQIIIGRLLGRNILQVLNRFGNNEHLIQEYLRLLGKGIKGIEVDNFNAHNINPILAKFLCFSFYRDNFFWTVTRRCAFNKNSRSLHKFEACNKECLKNKAIIENIKVDKKFLLEGNKIMNLEKTINRKIDYRLLERIVYKLKEN